MGDGVGQRVLLGLERVVLVGIVEAAASSSSTWKRSRSISRAGPVVAAEGGERASTSASGAGGVERLEVDAAEPVERLPLRGGGQQRLVGVLAVQVDQRAPRSASAAPVASRPST